MGLFTNGIRNTAAALAVGFVALAAPLSAQATATYSANASFELTLDSVIDVTGGAADPADWLVTASGLEDDLFFDDFGDATADATNNLVAPGTPIAVTDTVTQSVGVSGSATDGFAFSASFSSFDVVVVNLAADVLTFNFSYSAAVDADVTGSVADGDLAFAFASVDIFDDLGFVDILIDADADLDFALSDADADSNTFSFQLQPDGDNVIAGNIDADGFAEAVAPAIPEPTTLALFGLGLAGLAYRRRKTMVA